VRLIGGCGNESGEGGQKEDLFETLTSRLRQLTVAVDKVRGSSALMRCDAGSIVDLRRRRPKDR